MAPWPGPTNPPLGPEQRNRRTILCVPLPQRLADPFIGSLQPPGSDVLFANSAMRRPSRPQVFAFFKWASSARNRALALAVRLGEAGPGPPRPEQRIDLAFGLFLRPGRQPKRSKRAVFKHVACHDGTSPPASAPENLRCRAPSSREMVEELTAKPLCSRRIWIRCRLSARLANPGTLAPKPAGARRFGAWCLLNSNEFSCMCVDSIANRKRRRRR